MNTQSGLSAELERSMDYLVHLITYEEILRNAEVIDKLDDKRRTKLYNLLSWNTDMNKSFNKRLLNISEKIPDSMKEEFLNLMEDMKTFQAKFEASCLKLKKEDFYYEQLDDNSRKVLINHTLRAKEESKANNSKVERIMILERKKKNDKMP